MSDAICSGCGKTATVVDPRNGAMRCTDYPNCNFPQPVGIKPTKEQKEAVETFLRSFGTTAITPTILAYFLASREAKVTRDIMAMWVAERTQLSERYNALQVINAKLSKDLYDSMWNLGGISVLATSLTPQDYNKAMAMPALDEVAVLVTDHVALQARVTELEQENQSLTRTLDIYLAGDDKCDALLRSIGLDDTINVVPRLAELVEKYRKLKDATET